MYNSSAALDDEIHDVLKQKIVCNNLSFLTFIFIKNIKVQKW